MSKSTANQILADMVKDVGMEYVGQVIAGNKKADAFMQNILDRGLNEHEICAAKAGILILNISLKYRAQFSLTMQTDGVTFDSQGHRIVINWLMLLDAPMEILEQQLVMHLMPNHFAFTPMGFF